jgi:glycogen debranching enzyme
MRAAEGFDHRLPELYSGEADLGWNTPAPYPAACRPQAWSAAASISILTSLLGLQADRPGGRIRVRPVLPEAVLPLRIDGLAPGRIEVATDGTARVFGPPGVAVETGDSD